MLVLAWTMVGVAAAVQATTGFGFSLVSAPFLIAAYHAPLGIEINLVLSVSLNLLLLCRNYRLVDRRAAFGMLLPAAVATVVAGLTFKHVLAGTWAITAGALCLIGTLIIWSGVSFSRLRGPIATAGVGALSGAMNVTTGVGGPPIVLFAVNARWDPATSRATMQAFFLGINAVGLATLGLPAQFPVALMGVVIAGAVVGIASSNRMSSAHVRTLTLALATVGSVVAIVRAV